MWIRPMEEADITAVTDMEKKIFSVPWTEKMVRDMYESKLDTVFLTEDDCHICGYINIRILDTEAELMRIAVLPEYRCKGYGNLMMERMMCLLGDKQVEKAMLEVRSQNASAISLYRRYGFTDDGMRKDYYDDPTDDAILMSVKL